MEGFGPLLFANVVFGMAIVGLLAYVIIGQRQIHVLVNSHLSDVERDLAAALKKIEALEKLVTPKEEAEAERKSKQ